MGVVAVGLAVGAGVAAAGDVSGQIKIENEKALPSVPERSRGFTQRLPNPIKPVKKFNPFPYMVVVLEGQPEGEDASGPRRDRYALLGESFDRPLLAVRVGTVVELRNNGRGSPVLYSPSHPDKLQAAPLNPTSAVDIQMDEPMKVVRIRAQRRSHVRGAIVAFPNRFFAQVSSRGTFEIVDVPPGVWTVRIWYRDGLLTRTDDKIEVGRRTVRITPQVSSKLDPPADK